jgi:hypothetical protein
MLTSLGLIADAVGAVVVGLIAPSHQVLRAGTAVAGPKDSLGSWLPKTGWLLIVGGFLLQLVGQLRP